jgi:NADH-quinone oxidoreductase subunit H
MVSYEAALGLSIAVVLLAAGALSTNGIVAGQATWSWNLWMTGLVPFIVFFIAATAELNRPPFDLSRPSRSSSAGLTPSTPRMRFAMFYPGGVHEHRHDVGGHRHAVLRRTGRPDVRHHRLSSSDLADAVRLVLCQAGRVPLRLRVVPGHAAPLRYDQLMDLGWKVLIPLALGWFLVLTAIKVGADQGWNMGAVIGVVIIVLLAGWAVDRCRLARSGDPQERWSCWS